LVAVVGCVASAAAIASVLPVRDVVSAEASVAVAMASAEAATAEAAGKSYDSSDSTCRTFSASTVMVNGFWMNPSLD